MNKIFFWSSYIYFTLSSCFNGLAQKPINNAYYNSGQIIVNICLTPEQLVTQTNVVTYIKNYFRLNDKINFEFVSSTKDNLGYEHLKFKESYLGYNFYLGELIVHIKDNLVYYVGGRIY
jgi:Zn-dependent metalloprotease